jgi:hypothetical protein
MVSIGFEFPLGGSWKVIFCSHHTYHFSLFSLSSIPYTSPGIGFSNIEKGCTLPCGKKGIKAQRVKVYGKR